MSKIKISYLILLLIILFLTPSFVGAVRGILNKDGDFAEPSATDALIWSHHKVGLPNLTEGVDYGWEFNDEGKMWIKEKSGDKGHVALGIWWDQFTPPGKIPLYGNDIYIDFDIILDKANVTVTGNEWARVALANAFKDSDGNVWYTDLDLWDSPNTDSHPDPNVIYGGGDVYEYKVDQMPIGEWRHYRFNLTEWIKKRNNYEPSWGEKLKGGELESVYIVIELDKNQSADFSLRIDNFWLTRCFEPIKKIMLTTHADLFDTYKNNYQQIANLSNIIKYNYLFQLTIWGIYDDRFNISREKLKEIVNFWNNLGFVTGFYIDVAEARGDVALNYSDSILEKEWAYIGTGDPKSDHNPAHWLSRMSLDPSKSWYKYLKNAALNLIRDFGITALSIDRSDIIGIGGTQEDIWLRKWLDEVKTEAGNQFGINLKFVGNSFQDWQTTTASRFWFIGTDGVPAKDTQLKELENSLQIYKNLAQYTEEKIFYIAPWLQDPEILNNDDLLVKEYKNILERHNFTFFDDWTIFRLLQNYPELLCFIGSATSCEGVIPNTSWLTDSTRKTCNSSCQFSSDSYSISDGGYSDFYQPQCINQNPNCVNANQIRDYYCSGENYQCNIIFDSCLMAVSVSGVTTGDVSVPIDKNIEILVDVKNTGSVAQGWWMVGVEFWKVDDYNNPWGTRSQRIDTYYNGKDSTHGNLQGVSGADCFLISDPNGNNILDVGETIRIKCQVPASYYGLTSGNQRIMFWIHERDFGQDAAHNGCGGNSSPQNCGSGAGQCSYGGIQGCYGGSWWGDALSRVEPAQVKVIIMCNPNRTGSDGKCHQACGASLECEGKTPNTKWCDGNTKKVCDSNCQYSYQNCRTDAYDTDGGLNYLVRGTCYDYDGCNPSTGDCKVTPFTDFCSSDYVIEYFVSGSFCAATSYNCKNYGSSYTCSGGRCTSGGGGGGCPFLRVWDGEKFVNLGKLNIHSFRGDKIVETSFNMEPIEKGKYQIILEEAPYFPLLDTGSNIDYVRLKDKYGNECKLISAIHSKNGNIIQLLIKSDDLKARLNQKEKIVLTFEGCSGNDFQFTIEGNNWKFPMPMSIIEALQSFIRKILRIR
jgi:hypothetical protein